MDRRLPLLSSREELEAAEEAVQAHQLDRLQILFLYEEQTSKWYVLGMSTDFDIADFSFLRTQSSSINEITAAVRQMDEMTQHNAALVEETNAAIEQTEAQAVELDRIVEVNPVLDRENMTARVVVEMACSLLGKRIV